MNVKAFLEGYLSKEAQTAGWLPSLGSHTRDSPVHFDLGTSKDVKDAATSGAALGGIAGAGGGLVKSLVEEPAEEEDNKAKIKRYLKNILSGGALGAAGGSALGVGANSTSIAGKPVFGSKGAY